jgi:hypothetical protein
MRALLEIKEGEVPYKTGVTDWLYDKDGAVIFKVISKKRKKDGKVEFVCYTQRSDGIKRPIQHISFGEEDFWKVMNALEESLKEIFPKLKFYMQNVDLADGQGYRILKISWLNIFKLQVVNWFECKFNSLAAYIKNKIHN